MHLSAITLALAFSGLTVPVLAQDSVPRPPDSLNKQPATVPHPPDSGKSQNPDQQQQSQQEPNSTFKVNVKLVNVFTTVTDTGGAPV